MLNQIFEHWGVVVRPGATVKCDPGEFCCHLTQDSKGNEDVRVFVKVDGKEFLIGTLSVDRYPQYATSLVFKEEFELLHTSKTSTISALGYKFRDCKRKSGSDTSTEEDNESDEEVPQAIPLFPNVDDDESDEEVPQAIPLFPNADDDKSKENKCAVDKLDATESSKPKISLEERKDPEKLKADVGGTDDDESGDEDSSDDGSESSNEDDDSPKSAEGKNRSAETALTPPAKKARITTPSMGQKTGSGSAKKSGHVHVATPYPSSKQVKQTRSIIDRSNQSIGYACKSCSKTFYYSVGLETHCKVKHSARK